MKKIKIQHFYKTYSFATTQEAREWVKSHKKEMNFRRYNKLLDKISTIRMGCV